MAAYFSPFSLARRKFCREEDDALKVLVKENGTQDWIKVASLMPQRDSRQCKERWFHYLAPELVQSPWNQEEDTLLLTKVAEFGHKWEIIRI
jgi:hypothetical protein